MLNEVNGQFRLFVWKLILRVCTFDNKMGGTLVERFCFTVLGWILVCFLESVELEVDVRIM